ncbi:MAG: site-specific integrase [Methylococcaceae bacterium]|nr:site-specific integrase [Methylococcaceae bacterium]MCI0732479.1 site-specific integrase [Methylococcaceae bacterium]
MIRLAEYYHRSPDRLTGAELQGFFLYLAKDRGLSDATCRLYLNAIRFLYLQVPGRDSFGITLVVSKRAQRIPELLTRAEVGRILSACRNFKHRMLLTTCHGCGLRVGEGQWGSRSWISMANVICCGWNRARGEAGRRNDPVNRLAGERAVHGRTAPGPDA